MLQKIIRRINTNGGGGPTEPFPRLSHVQDAEKDAHANAGESGPESPTSDQPTHSSNAPPGWEMAVSRSTGQLYYINTVTRESQYDFPAGIPPLPLGWSIELSRSTGTIYFVDCTTGFGQYHHPLSTPQGTSPTKESRTPIRSPSDEGDVVEVTFDFDGPLGIGWKFDSENDDLILGKVGPGTPAAQHPELVPGLRLTQIGDTSIKTLRSTATTNASIMQLLKKRPVTLTLRDLKGQNSPTHAMELAREANERFRKDEPSDKQDQVQTLTAQLAERDEKIKQLEAQAANEAEGIQALMAADSNSQRKLPFDVSLVAVAS